MDFLVELTGTPSGVAEREETVERRVGALGDCFQNADGRSQADIFVDLKCGGLRVVGGMQHEATAGFHRTAEMDPNLARRCDRLNV